MRHLVKGRKLGRNASHRKAMFRNMAASLIKSARPEEGAEGNPKVPGRIVTTLAKAKELRPYVEKLITLAKKARPHEDRAQQFATDADRGSDAWKSWRESDQWSQWAEAMAPAVEYRRRAFALLRDNRAVDILFSDLADRFADRNGGYTRVIQLASVRLGDGGKQALVEFVGERDRVKQTRTAPVVVEDDDVAAAPVSESDEPEEVAEVADEEAAESAEEASEEDVAESPEAVADEADEDEEKPSGE